MAGFDMHIHSIASDGGWSAEEIIDAAIAKGLDGIAITDHDTVGGLKAAMSYGEKCNFPVIPGIELSTKHDGRDIHVLGYWIDADAIEADGRLRELREAREQRCYKIVARLDTLGMKLDADAIIAAAGSCDSIGRPHIAKAMVEAGYVDNIKEAFVKWIGQGMPAYVPRMKMTPFEAAKRIMDAKGAAVLAHPGVGVPDYLIGRLVKQGIVGIEAYHPEHKIADEKKYLQISRRFHIAVTGGSDFHSIGLRCIGYRVAALSQVELLARLRQQRLAIND